mgnify:CR=1 FL=1
MGKYGAFIYERAPDDSALLVNLFLASELEWRARGVKVRQGQIIGYVGSTGLATGPHVCFRFWKNGREVDHLRLNLPQPEPIKGAVLDEFKTVRDQLIQQLNNVPYHTHEEITGQHAEAGDGLEKAEP